MGEIGQNIVVISTHMSDVRELCSSMAIINRGEVILSGDPETIVEKVRGTLWRKTVSKAELADCEQRYQVVSVRLLAGRPVIHISSPTNPGDGFIEVEPDLEDVYFQQIGLSAAKAAA